MEIVHALRDLCPRDALETAKAVGLLLLLLAAFAVAGTLDAEEMERHAAWEAEVAQTDWVMW